MGVLRVLCVMVVVAFTAISSSAVAAPEPSLGQAVAPVQAPVAVPAPVPAAPTPVAPAAAPPPPAPAAPAVPALVAGTPCAPTVRACIDLSANRTWLIRNGAIEYGPVPITHGRKGYRTQAGTFRVGFKSQFHRSSLFDDAPMPYSVFFNGGIAFHQGSLRQLSHGCIHLSRAAAQTYFGSLSRGDVVQVVR